MRKLLYNTGKELLILLRDLPGLAILFLMPLLLIIVITLIQNNAIRSVNGTDINMLFVNHDQGTFGELVRDALAGSEELNLLTEYQNKPLTDSLVAVLVGGGKFKAGMIIPAKTTDKTEQQIIDKLQGLVTGEGETPGSEQPQAVLLLYDPAINHVVRVSIGNAVEMATRGAGSQLTTQVLFRQLGEVIQTDDPLSLMILDALKNADAKVLPQNPVGIQEQFPGDRTLSVKPGITQNNVPAFSLFAMFFIVIPLAGSLIAEKNEGTYDRIRTLPVSYRNILMGKTLAYLLVCFLQFLLMVLVGIFIFPAVFGLPALEMGSWYFSIFMATLASALAAIGFGLLVGTYASTHNQAAMFGAILVVLMAALGGIFMPVYMMPEKLRVISFLSPLRWGIDAYLDIFVRSAGLTAIWKNLLLLFAFFGISVGVAARRF